MKAFIQDRERVLDYANDLLKTGIYAENLVKVIENTPKNKVLTIGVFGGWGTGKSSIIRTAQDTIEKAYDDVKFITYDAWKYANDSFRRMFLLKLQQELKMQPTEDMMRFYQSENVEQEAKTVLSARGLLAVIVVFAVLLALLWLTPLDLEWNVGVTTLGTLLSLVLTLWNGCFYDLKLTINKPALFAPEQFEACFKEMMSKCLKEINWFQKTCSTIKDYVKVGKVPVVGLDKLVVVIDNIDRCPSDMAYQLLTDIKTFLSNEEYNLVFVVPVDDEALKKHLFRKLDEKKGYNIDKEKEEFLRKFFNVTLRIKPHQETELQHFAHEINRENNLGYSNDTLLIVAKEFTDNPRRIIQLLNNLSGDLALYDDVFAGKYETAICTALILQEVYPDFYKRVTKDLNLVKQFDETKEENDALKDFMRIAGNTLKQVQIKDLDRIFTNTSSLFSGLPADIKKSVRSYDADKVIEFANANEEKKANLVDFIIESLSIDVKYEATSQTTQWIDFISCLYKAGAFDASRFSSIDAALSSYYKTAVPDIDKPDALCYMGSQMNEAGIDTLRSAIIEFLTVENAKEDSNFTNVLYAYYANFTTNEDCNAIAGVVEDFYNDNPLDKGIKYTETQIEKLFGDSFVTSQINELITTNDEARLENIIWCIKNNKKIASETYTTLFAKFIELFGNTRGKSKSEYLKFINDLQALFDALPTKSRGNELVGIYGVITNVRGIPHPSLPSQPQHDTKKSILDEVDAEEAKVVTAFCYEIMRITGGSVDISASISKLYHKCKDAVVEGALKMHSLGISIASLAGTLIQADDYNSANDLSLLEIILSLQADGSFMLDDNTVKNKIVTLVTNANNIGVELLLSKLASNNQILNMVTEYVASLDSETINNLPISIAKHAVSTFNRNNAEFYKDNAEFLILVLNQGNARQKKEVVRLMKDKINKEEDLDTVVLVLDNLETEDKNMLKTLVGELKEIKESETIDEETKKRVAELVNKLSSNNKK